MNEPKVDIEHVAKLARIELSVEEEQKFTEDFSKLLGYFEKLNSVKTDDVEPSAHAFPIFNVLRNDVPEKALEIDALLKNAPAQRENQIVVPRIVDDAS